MPMAITVTRIREFCESDAPAILRLARALQAHEAALFERMKPPETIGAWYLDALLRECAEKSGAVLVAQDESGAVIGYATLLVESTSSITEADYCYARIGDFVVDEQARRRGVGGSLLIECERRARVAGVNELRVDVLAANRQARHVYDTRGFEDVYVTMRKVLA
jgi:GNAT superfamily N-acetyltransferase